MLSLQALARARKSLLSWYAAYGRKDLPWRNTGNPYHIYLSEVMLQQTQVKTILERYYFPFLRQFPTLEALANAPREKALKAWEGMGYYNRAIYLHETAKQCSKELPKTVEELLALPGIGKNTAHAIMSFAHRQPVPIMEANVRRIIARVFALKQAKEKDYWHYAELLLNRRDPFTHNQAMMDIGALICTPKTPACTACPLNAICEGRHNPGTYPAPKNRKTVPVRHKNILIYERNGKYLVQRRTARHLQGLWGFIESDTPPRTSRQLGSITQTYSHYKLVADVYLASSARSSGSWKSLKEIEKLPLSKADYKVLTLVTAREHPPAITRRAVGHR